MGLPLKEPITKIFIKHTHAHTHRAYDFHSIYWVRDIIEFVNVLLYLSLSPALSICPSFCVVIFVNDKQQ